MSGAAPGPVPAGPTPDEAPARASADDRAARVVVVGAGIAGLATAALLAREGRRVTVLEARDVVGGRAGSWAKDGFRFDTGPSWYLMPEVFDHFFRLLGTSADEQLDLVRLDPGYRVLFERRGRLDVAADRATNVERFEAVEPGAGAALEAYLDVAEDTYAMALRHFLYTTYASLRPLVHRDVLARLPRLAALLTRSLEQHVGARFRDPRLRQVLGYPAVFLGAAPRITPSMYHLMSRLDLADGVLYPQGGFARLIEAVHDVAVSAGAEVRTGARVTAITTEPAPAAPGSASRGAAARAAAARAAGTQGRARATGVRWTDADGEHWLPADVVVSTADLHHTETALLPPALRTHSRRWWDRRVPGPSAVLVYLGVRGALPQLEHHTLLFTEDWQEGFDRIFPRRGLGGLVAGRRAGARGGAAGEPEVPAVPDPVSLYVCRPSATDPDVAPEGSENLFVLVPVPPDPGLGRGGVDGAGDAWVEAVADAAVAQIARWADVPDLVERVVVRRTVGPADFAEDLGTWRGTALGPAHTLAQSAMFRAGNASRRVDGLLYAGGSVVPGIGLPMCLISAELVVKRLRGDTSTGPLPEPLVPSAAAPSSADPSAPAVGTVTA